MQLCPRKRHRGNDRLTHASHQATLRSGFSVFRFRFSVHRVFALDRKLRASGPNLLPLVGEGWGRRRQGKGVQDVVSPSPQPSPHKGGGKREWCPPTPTLPPQGEREEDL